LAFTSFKSNTQKIGLVFALRRFLRKKTSIGPTIFRCTFVLPTVGYRLLVWGQVNGSLGCRTHTGTLVFLVRPARPRCLRNQTGPNIFLVHPSMQTLYSTLRMSSCPPGLGSPGSRQTKTQVFRFSRLLAPAFWESQINRKGSFRCATPFFVCCPTVTYVLSKSLGFIFLQQGHTRETCLVRLPDFEQSNGHTFFRLPICLFPSSNPVIGNCQKKGLALGAKRGDTQKNYIKFACQFF